MVNGENNSNNKNTKQRGLDSIDEIVFSISIAKWKITPIKHFILLVLFILLLITFFQFFTNYEWVPIGKEAVYAAFSEMIHTQAILVSIVLAIFLLGVIKQEMMRDMIQQSSFLLYIMIGSFIFSIIYDILFLSISSNLLDKGVPSTLYISNMGLFAKFGVLWFIINLIGVLVYFQYVILLAMKYISELNTQR